MKESHLSKESIAIVGMSCRFPNVSSLDEFWELLKNGKDTIAEIPKERWNLQKYYDSDPSVMGKTNQRHASLLSGVHDFDPLFFNISPAEAIEMSPSQKLMLELAWEAIENSTTPFHRIQGHNVGVYVGNIWTDFEHYRKAKNARATLHSAVGMSSNVIANRVSFAFGFTGPSLVIDTGCSASLVALHLACKSLLNNEIDMSVVGGVNHILDPDKYVELTQFGGLSVNGKCSTFDNDADGFVRGEGGGALLLKRLSDAERDQDKILAVIQGTAVNNNGYNDTLPATSIQGQKSLLERVYREAGILASDVHYIEAHGTGTKLGDPNEAKAIGEFFRTGRNGTALRIGSVKTNIGHTEATAGIAGLIKVVLAMQHKLLPPNLNFKTPNTNIPFADLKLEVQKTVSDWPVKNGETRKAGINSFGWGGTNAHTVLEEYHPKQLHVPSTTLAERFCLPLSAKSSQALRGIARAYLSQLENSDDETCKTICRATALRKAEFDHRHLFSGNNREELLDQLRSFIADESEVTPCNPATENPKIVFVFPGQGGQWLGMGRDLMAREKIFQETILECDATFRKYTDWSLLEQLQASPEASRLTEIDVIQPATCAIQIALAKLWISWGISPQAVVGHSMGEVAAAYISGALTLDDAAKIICTRSLLMKTVSGKGGAMAVTELSKIDAENVAALYPGKLSLAVNNSPKSTVLAGDKNSIAEVIADLETKGLFCRLVKVDVASHSPQMDPLKEPLRQALQNIKPSKTSIPFVSTVLNKVTDGAEMGTEYWVNNLRGMVQFAAVVERLLHDQHSVFIEVNSHPVLVNAVNECADFHKKKITALASLYRDKSEREEMMKNLGEFYTKGYSIPWNNFFGSNSIPHVQLPAYTFQRERFEIEDLSEEIKITKEISAKFPLLGDKINLANTGDTSYWESSISLNKFPYLRDHVIHDTIELPVSCHIEMVFEAIADIFKGTVPVRIEELNFTQYLTLSENKTIDIQIKLTWTAQHTGKVYIFKKDNAAWEQLAEGTIVNSSAEPSSLEQVFDNLEYLAPAFTEGGTYYDLLHSVGQQYGKHFQQLTGVDRIGSQQFPNVLFSIKPDHYIRLTSDKYEIHPALMSSFFQPVFAQLTQLEEGNFLDVKFTKIGRLALQGVLNYGRELRGLLVFKNLVRKSDAPNSWVFNADITIANHDNTVVMHIAGLEGKAEKRIPSATSLQNKKAATDVFGIRSEGISYEDRQQALERMITHHVAKIIKTSPARIKRTISFKNMGVDSLMAVQLRNNLEKEVSLKIPVGMFWSHPNIGEYAAYLNSVLDVQQQGNSTPEKKNTGINNSWFTVPEPNRDAAMRVFCFHDAGGSASLFDGWEKHIDKSLIELVVLEMPGRGRRLDETPYEDAQRLIHDIMPELTTWLTKPYIFLGHSMGGLIAFELIRALRSAGTALPEALFISSTSGLNAYQKSQVDYTVSAEELVNQYPHLHIDNIGSLEMQEILINILRADLKLLHNYEYTAEAPLSIPIIAIHGNEDERVKRNQIEQWEAETASSFRLIPRSGGHRYIQHDAEFVIQLIQDQATAQMTLAEKRTNF
jgi:acyl transferase domain-containing protein